MLALASCTKVESSPADPPAPPAPPTPSAVSEPDAAPEGDGTVLLGMVHEADPTACPPMPGHMANLSYEIAAQRANWTDTPAECTVAADSVSLGLPLAVLLVTLTVYSKSKHKLIRCYHLQVLRPLTSDFLPLTSYL